VLSETVIRAVAARSLAGVTQLQFLTSNVSCDSKAFGLRFRGLTSRAWPSTRVARRRRTLAAAGHAEGDGNGDGDDVGKSVSDVLRPVAPRPAASRRITHCLPSAKQSKPTSSARLHVDE